MIAAAVVLPAVVGWLSTRMVDASERPRAAGGLLRAIARGYPYTLGLALSLITMTVFAPIMKIRNAFRAIGTPRMPARS